MALPTIIINSSTGSDTTASGAGPSVALTGSLAQTLSNTTVNITDGGVSLAGVAIDGSAVLWVSTASGRQFSAITNITGSIGAYVVTVITTYSVSATGQTWGIGGQRATLASSIQLGLDMLSGWTIDIQTNQVLTANFRMTPNAVSDRSAIVKSSQTIRPVISTSTNNVTCFDLQGANNIIIQHLSFKSTAGTPGDGIALGGFSAAGNYVIVDDCVVDGFLSGIQDHDNGGNTDIWGMIATNCEVKNCSTGIAFWGSSSQIAGCYVHNCTGRGVWFTGTRARSPLLVNSVFDSNTGENCEIDSTNQISVMIQNCVFSNATIGSSSGFGLRFNGSTSIANRIQNCIFYGNFAYGINNSNAVGTVLINNCAFGGNGISDVNGTGLTTGTNPVILTASPFTSSTDFSLNNTAGGGSACKQAGYKLSFLSSTANAPDIGAIQQSGGSGSSVGILIF